MAGFKISALSHFCRHLIIDRTCYHSPVRRHGASAVVDLYERRSPRSVGHTIVLCLNDLDRGDFENPMPWRSHSSRHCRAS
ncbi:hypothetical protein FMEAI12_4630040 [Parafrankia sp. Ea1.12]|nr:hypothetical protein FMEAI12_4630040 [Parafrankia sp. Ea1.12]